MKKIKILLPVLATALLLSLSSISCAQVKGKTFKHESKDATISFTTKSDFTLKVEAIEVKGTYTVKKKIITVEYKVEEAGVSVTMKGQFEILDKNTLKGPDGKKWKKV